MPQTTPVLSFEALQLPDKGGSSESAVGCWSADRAHETELRAIANELTLYGLFLVCGVAGDVDFDLIEAAISLTDHTRVETPGGPPAAIDALDKSFQSLRGTLLKMSASDPLRGRAASRGDRGWVGVDQHHPHGVDRRLECRQKQAVATPPTEVAGYITIAWSQLHWGSRMIQRTYGKTRCAVLMRASVCVRWPLSGAAATLLSCAQAPPCDSTCTHTRAGLSTCPHRARLEPRLLGLSRVFVYLLERARAVGDERSGRHRAHSRARHLRHVARSPGAQTPKRTRLHAESRTKPLGIRLRCERAWK